MRHAPNLWPMLTSCGFVASLTLSGVLALPAPQGWDDLRAVLRGEFQTAYSDAFAAELPFMDLATSAVALTRYAVFGQASTGAIIGAQDWVFSTEELDLHPDFARNMARNALEVATVADTLAAKDIALIVAVLPDKAEIYADKLGVRRPDAVRDRRRAFVQMLDAHGVQVLDAGPVLQAARHSRDVFLKDDTHWSPFGAQQVAHAVAALPVLAGLPVTLAEVETVRAGLRDHDGDLLNFIPTGALRTFGGPPQQQVEHVTTTTAAPGGLFGDAPVEIALVGTSYSAIPTWNFSGFLEEALHTQVLNLSLEGQGPFPPMHQFLASPDASNPDLKAVIWEIPARYVSKEF